MKKQTKSGLSIHSQAKAKHSAKKAAARKLVRHRRPLHRHIALNPLSVFALLCVGVLLATFTMNVAAGSYTVTAVNPAPPLTQPATITSPTDGTQTSVEDQVVIGTCPASSYVDVTDNGVLSAEETCTLGAFDVNFDLTPGTNLLLAQDYNITNSPGPTSTGVTVTYTPPPPPPVTPTQPTTTPAQSVPQTAVPQELIVTQVDIGVPLEVSSVQNISYRPTFAGIAPPFSRVYIVIHSDTYTCDTTANNQGYWSCSLPDYLPAAVHHVDVSAKTPQGTTLTYPEFEVKVTGQSPAAQPTPATFKITSNYSYAVYNIGEKVNYTIHITGGQAPYAFSILWGDGSGSTIVRQNADSFTISHKYGWINAITKVRTLKIQGIDVKGQVSSIQFSVPLRNLAYRSASANATHATGLWWLFDAVQPWLWLLWPGYIILILLVISFWLGEREEMRRLTSSDRSTSIQKHHVHYHR